MTDKPLAARNLDLARLERVLLDAAKHTPFSTEEWDRLQAALDEVQAARR